ncbi:MAG: sugar ABC transporter ATP-binding protein [Acidimicrobiia bacterium]|nr:sugar ABC transporter ATP-binding protein [Acidimicrobiia bacterium]
MLELCNISKRFSSVLALDDVSATFARGEVHALVGENGAGKSTLAHIAAGSLHPDAGRILLDGTELRHLTRHGARNRGVTAVFQEFSLVPTLSVRENLYLGREPARAGFVARRPIARGADEILERLGFSIDPAAPVGSLGRAEQQMVEIAKALLEGPSVLILDEPTSALTERDAEHLYRIVGELRSEGVAIVYITHRMEEIRRLADTATILRDGHVIDRVRVADVTDDRIVELMVGRAVSDLFPEVRHRHGDVALRLENVSTANGRVRDVSIEVRAGEIVGLAGLAGSGKRHIARACMGLERVVSGTIEVRGERVARPTPRSMIRRGVCYLPGDRRAEGLVMPRSVRENASLAALDLPSLCRIGLLRLRAELRSVRGVVDKLRIRTPSMNEPVGTLSGGNQQKVVFARALLRDMHVFLVEEPTSGIDVGSRAEIYRFIRDLCEGGAAVLLVSSDLPEILHLASRAYVVHRGQLRAELEGDELTEVAVVGNFFEVEQPSGAIGVQQ